jgi:peptidoglycan hydrolase-like protein with peptidoglycan-binding domain
VARTLRATAFSAVLVSPFAVVGTAVSSVAATIPAPPTKSLPSALDVVAPYQAPTSCDPTAKPGPIAFAKLLNATYGTRYYGIGRACASDVSEHYEGRALDWMISAAKPDEKALADAIVGWLVAPDAQGRQGAMARRFGINYIIWNRHMWRSYAPERGWAVYTGVSPHTDHIHFTFTWGGALMKTSWWTGTALTTVVPPPVVAGGGVTSTGYPVLQTGSRGAEVITVQRIVGTPADGDFGPMTKAAVVTWQAKQGLQATGVVDDTTWRKLISLGLVPAKANTELAKYATTTIRLGSRGDAVTALQRALGDLAVDGDFGPATDEAVRNYQKTKGLAVNGVVDPAVWQVLMGGPVAAPPPPPAPQPTYDTEFTAYKSLVLKVGSKGAAVKLVQSRLGGLAVDGDYGPLTAAAVAAYRKAKALPAGAVVDRAVWTKLEAQAHPLLPYWSTVLKRGSTGAAVTALQRALRIPADGDFGPQTEAAVRAAQTRAALSVNGLVGVLTWRAVEKQAYAR